MNLPVPVAAPSPDEGSVVGFDYASLDQAQAQEAQAVAERIRSRMKAGIIETGLDLISIKAQIGHGAFGAWIEAEFRMDVKTAQNYMRTASVFGDKSEIVSLLPASTVYTLAAKSTPETIREDVLRQIEEGQRPEPAVIAETIRTAKQQERERKEAEARAAELAKLTDEQRADLERKAKRRHRSRAQREAEEAHRQAEWKAEQEAKKRAAQEAVCMVAERLGTDFEHFASLVEQASYHFDSAVKARAREPVAVAL